MKKVVFALAAIAAASAFADRMILKSGSVLTGTGAVVAGDKVKFTSDDLGAVEIPADKVAFVETANENKVEVAALPPEQKPPETHLVKHQQKQTRKSSVFPGFLIICGAGGS